MNWSITLGISLVAIGGLFIWVRIFRGSRTPARQLIGQPPPASEPVRAYIQQSVPDGQERLATQSERDDMTGIIERGNTTSFSAHTLL